MVKKYLFVVSIRLTNEDYQNRWGNKIFSENFAELFFS